jgi:hypothetical protein
MGVGKERMSQLTGGNKMNTNYPLISSAKVRGLMKKNGIDYVDADAALYSYQSVTTRGINVWQLGDSICLRPYGNDQERSEYVSNLEKALSELGLMIVNCRDGKSMRIQAIA